MASKLELTLEERLDQIFKEYTQKLGVAFYPVHSIYKQEAIDKVLSMLEPVELEALGDEELVKAVDSCNTDLMFDPSEYIPELKAISRAIIKHNQSKGQLHRVKE